MPLVCGISLNISVLPRPRAEGTSLLFDGTGSKQTLRGGDVCWLRNYQYICI